MQHISCLKKWLIFIILFFAVLYFFAITPRLSKSNEMAAINAYAYAHRGLFDNTSSAPENTLSAFAAAIDHGYGIELDVQLTKDLVAVVHHDTDLLRSCQIDQKIADLTYEELQRYTLFNSQETIPTFKEVLSLIDGQTPILIELKVELDYKSTCEVVASLLDEYNGLYTIQSFSPYALKWFKENRPETLRGQLAQNYFKSEPTGYGTLTNFILTHFLSNFLTRPDYLAYYYAHAHEVSLNLCHFLYKTPLIAWTITSEADALGCEKQFNTYILEGFLPSSAKVPAAH